MGQNSAIVLSTEAIEHRDSHFSPEEGAEVRFLGVVRATEGEATLTGIDYRAYHSMAESMLQKLVEEGGQALGPHRVYLRHRLGFVPVGEPSIVIYVQSKHSKAAFDACGWYLAKVKDCVPIWKHPVQA